MQVLPRGVTESSTQSSVQSLYCKGGAEDLSTSRIRPPMRPMGRGRYTSYVHGLQ
ncbi:hypothetical protein H8959_003797 [Pygathrix nigripes]